MAPISDRHHDSTASNDGGEGEAALKALIQFPGTYTPAQVRERMVGPILNAPPAAIWRRTTISHSNPDGCFSLYACERTGEAMWVPTGEYFVANRARGAQPSGTIMDYLFSQRTQSVAPEGYGIHHADNAVFGENGNIRRPKNNHASMMGRSYRADAARLHRFNSLARQEPAVAGTGSKKMAARRARRESAGVTSPSSITSTTTTVIIQFNIIHQWGGRGWQWLKYNNNNNSNNNQNSTTTKGHYYH